MNFDFEKRRDHFFLMQSAFHVNMYLKLGTSIKDVDIKREEVNQMVTLIQKPYFKNVHDGWFVDVVCG